jgi:hypothetical protein
MAKAATQVYSTSALSRLSGLDRATVAKRLKDVPFVEGSKGAKSYTLEVALPALITGQSTAYDEAELRKLQAEADLKEHKLAVERAEYVKVSEVRDYAVRLFQGIFQRVAVQYPREIAEQLYRAESAAQINEIQARELGRVFNDLRDNHKSFL